MPIIIHPATPWLIAIGVLILGVILWRAAREHRTRLARGVLGSLGIIFAALGGLLVVGASVSAIAQARARAAYPAPGKLVDVGGYRIHIWCDGPRGARTLVLLTGSYSQALWGRATQRDLAARHRVCILDRGGTGWSDVGPFPRSVDRISSEIRQALAGAGERAPFVPIGHSFGGVYAAAFAQRYPREMSGLVLLDPTAPGWFGLFAAQGCPPMDGSPLTMVGTMFGLAYIDALNPLRGPGPADSRKRLGADWEPLVAWELRPAARWSARSAMHEACTDFYATARAPGALGDLPLLLIPQTPDLAQQRQFMPKGLNAAEQANYFAFMRDVSTQMAALSRRHELVYAPPGAGHLFIDTRPDFTAAQINRFIAGLPATPARSSGGS